MINNPSWIRSAYKSTQVPWARSQAAIYKMLGDLGIYEIRFTNLKDQFILEFVIQLEDGKKPRAVRIAVPMKYEDDDEKDRTRELNIVHRILLNHLKAKFVSIGTGLSEFEEEFMPHIAIGKGGALSNMYQVFKQKMLPQIVSGKTADIKMIEPPQKED